VVVVEIGESLIATEGDEVVACLLLVALEMARRGGVVALVSREPHSFAKCAYEWGDMDSWVSHRPYEWGAAPQDAFPKARSIDKWSACITTRS
jgi:hypothetical protein